jgi:glycosyltransferase involved in cell wall biosynthesis
MEYNVKVTLGVCVKNNQATVKEAIGSIINQDFPHKFMEVIVIDGCSKDKTVQIIANALSNSDIEFRVLSEDNGLGFARQMVVDNAAGDYIIWVDGDMVLAPDHVQKQVAFMERNHSVGIAGGKFQGYPGENLVATLESIEWLVEDYVHGHKASLRPTLHRAGGCIYRVEAINQVGGLDCNIKGALEDLDVEYRIGEQGWSTYFITDAIFYDRRKENWRGIWNENFWYGYGGHYFLHKHGKGVSASALFDGIRGASIAYGLTRKKIVFLILFQHFFKKVAWFFGYIRAHIDNYEHNVVKAQTG